MTWRRAHPDAMRSSCATLKKSTPGFGHFPGYQVTLQALRLFPDGVFDVLQIESQDGEAREVYFALRRLSRKWTSRVLKNPSFAMIGRLYY